MTMWAFSGFHLWKTLCRPAEGHVANGHGIAAAAPQPLVLPSGQVLAQIAPLTPEQLAELAQNTQLKNQLYAQLLYRSMAQAGPGQAPMQLHHLLNLSPPLMVPGAAPQQPASPPNPQMALPTGELVQNLLVMSGAQAQGSSPTAQRSASAKPQPSAPVQQPNSPAVQPQSTAPPAKPVQPVSYEAIASAKSPVMGSGERQAAAPEGSSQGAAPGAAERIDQSPAVEAADEDPDEVEHMSLHTSAAPPASRTCGHCWDVAWPGAHISACLCAFQASCMAPCLQAAGAECVLPAGDD